MDSYSQRLEAAYKAYLDAVEDISQPYSEVSRLRSEYEQLWWETEIIPKVSVDKCRS
jgi:hypothetical protein